MFTSKMKALDSDDSDEEESNDPSAAPSITKEALEQKTMLQYQEALQHEISGQFSKSEKILRSLLESQIVKDCNSGKIDGSHKSSFLHLKYCITLNLGHCLSKQGKLEESLDYYLKASYIEDSDLNLWYKIGTVSMKVPDLKLAATAFGEGLKLSPNHWGCLDKIVTVLYALGDFLTCLYFIKKGLQLDSEFTKGRVLKKAIFNQSPYLITDFSIFYPNEGEFKEDNSDDIAESVSSAIINEVEELASKEKEAWNLQSTYTTDVSPCMMTTCLTWLQLSSTILQTHQKNYDQDPLKIVNQHILFDTSAPMEAETLEPVNNSSHSEASHESNNNKPEEENNDQAKGGTYEKWLSSQKRRSARVRSTVRREEPSLARSLSHLIPPHLLHRGQPANSMSDDSMETMDLYRLLFESKESDDNQTFKKNTFSPEERKKVLAEQSYFGTYKEVEEVRTFMQNVMSKKFTLIDCIKECIEKLSGFWKLLWPENLTKMYILLFKLFMKYNNPFICRGHDLRTLEEDLSIILFGELILDKWLSKGKSKGKPSPLGKTVLGGDFPSLYLGALDHRACVTTDPEILARIYWLQGMLFYYLDDVDPTTNALETLLYEPWFQDLEVKLPNLQRHHIIESSYVSDILKSLSINKSLASVTGLYQEGSYEDVIVILTESLMADQLVANSVTDFVLSRFKQFSIIIDSLWKLAKYKECFYWSECFLFDCLSEYKNSTNEEDRSWHAKCISTLLDGIVTLIDTVGNIVYGTLPPDRQNRLVQTLSSIICLQMDVPETTTEMTIESIAPWLLLYHIVKFDEEAKDKACNLNSSGASIDQDSLPSSLTILHQGHDYLGRRGWCCFNEGSLLFFSLDVMYPFLEKLCPESKALAAINQEIDQIFFCLYGQQKKSRGRQLIDHKTMGLALTWNRARQVFKFTQPKELPSYDSSGKCSINAETESMYLKLIACVPESCNPSRGVPEMTKFIEGDLEEIPSTSYLLPEDMANIYYLLAHFYFRNKYWNKSLKYYLLDVCANPTRVDSWACLALARGSLLDTKINSCDVIKSETDVLKSAEIVIRCYDRSLRLDPLQSTLWIEKGSFCYTVQAFCSNVLKKEVNLSLEMFDVLENKKEDMLASAMNCFSKANSIWYSCNGVDIQDERWLHQYMMGKISEKKGDDPQVFIDHYLKASELLHEMGALYPSSISYAAPQRLAVESLEIYYRIHASVLKFLEKIEGKMVPKEPFLVYKRAILKMSESPFIVNCQISKEEAPKPEIVSIKDANKFDSDDPYSPGQDTTDCLSNSNSLNPFNIPGAFKIQDSNIASVEVCDTPTSKEVTDSKNLEVDTEMEVTPEEPLVVKEEEKSGTPSLKLPEETLKDGKEQPVTSDIQSLDNKETDGAKRTISIESDGPTTSDSVSKTSASGADKPSKTSDSSSDDSSSSDSDSSSDSSSSDSSSSTSDQESESNAEPENVKVVQEEQIDWDSEYDTLLKKCLSAMEYCSKRFQEHFKSLYHLAYFYFKSKKYKDLKKVKSLLLETGGLFAERKSTNFFNGIWRIPNNEIDRPGNFASHMGRCTQLLLEFLKETRDYKMLVDLALFLKLVPEADKKYLRDTERGDLCHEALSLAAISMRKKLSELSGEANLKPFLIDVFCIYKKVLRSNLKEQKFTSILNECYFKTTGFKSEHNIELDVQMYLKRDQLGLERSPFIPGVASSEQSPLNMSTSHTSSAVLSSTVVTSVSSVNIGQAPPQTAPLDLQTKVTTSMDSKTVIPSSSKPASSPITKTLTSPVPKPFNAPTTKPLTAPTTKPSTAQSTKPLTAPNTKSLTAPNTKSLTVPTTKPLTAPTTKPITPVSKSLNTLMNKTTPPSVKTTPAVMKTTPIPSSKASISPIVKSSTSTSVKTSLGPSNKVSSPSLIKPTMSQPMKSATPPLAKPINSPSNMPSNFAKASRSRGDGSKRPRGRPPGSVCQPLRHSINAILQQRPEMFLPIDPFKTQPRNMLSITPVGSPKPRKPKTQQVKSQQSPIPASISITSVASQPKPFSYQAVSITPRPKVPPPETKLPPATIIPIPIPTSLQSQAKSRPHPMPTPSATGPPPAKMPHIDYSVAQAIRSLGNTITITTSMGELRPKSSSSASIPSSSNLSSVSSTGLQSSSKPLPKSFSNQLPPLSVSNKSSMKTKAKTSSHNSSFKSVSSSQISSSSMSRSLSSSQISSSSTAKALSSSSLPKSHSKAMSAQITPIPLPRSFSSSHLIPSSSTKTSPVTQIPPNPLPRPPPAAPGSSQQKDSNIKVILLDD